MLSLYLGEMEQAIYYPPAYFDNQYEKIESPVLGLISVKEISGGVKTLMLLAFDQSGRIFNASACGDNCAKWILKIGKKRPDNQSPLSYGFWRSWV